MAIAFDGTWLNLTGGNSGARLTPDNIIADAAAFSTGSTYAVNALVKNDAGGGLGLALYRCSSAVTVAGAFNAAQWTLSAFKPSTKSIRLNNSLSIGGFYDDSDWTSIFAISTRFQIVTNGNWLSGQKLTEASGRKVIGRTATIILLNTAIGWPFSANSQIQGGVLTWYGMTIKFYDVGFVKLIDTSATVHTLESVTIDGSFSTHKWLMMGLASSATSSLNLYGVTCGQLGSLPPINWGDAQSWSFPDTIADMTVRIDELSPTFANTFSRLFLGRHQQTLNSTYQTANPKYDWVLRDNWSALADAGESQARVIEHDFKIVGTDENGTPINPTVRISSANGEKALGTASGGAYNVRIETYRKTNFASGTTTISDDTNLSILLRTRDRLQVSMSTSYADLQAGAVIKNGILYPDAYYTTDQSANLADVTFVTSGSVITGMNLNANMTLDRLWDIAKAYLVANMQIANPFSANGNEFYVGSVNVSVSSGRTLTEGTKFKTLRTTGAVTNNGSIAAQVFVNGTAINGSVTLTGAQLSGATIRLTNNSGAIVDTQTAYASSTYTYWTPLNSTGTWTVKVAKYGLQPLSWAGARFPETAHCATDRIDGGRAWTGRTGWNWV